MSASGRTQLALAFIALALVLAIAWSFWRQEEAAERGMPAAAASAPVQNAPAAVLEPDARDPLEVATVEAANVSARPESAAQSQPSIAVPVARFLVKGRVRMAASTSGNQLARNAMLEAQVQGVRKHRTVARAAQRALVAPDGSFELEASDIAAHLFDPENPIVSVRVAVSAGAEVMAEIVVPRDSVECAELSRGARACELEVELALEERAERCFVTGRVVDEQGRGVPEAVVGLLLVGAPPEFVVETLSGGSGNFLLRATADSRTHSLLIAAEGFLLREQEIGAIAAEGMHIGELVLSRGHCLTGSIHMGALEHVQQPVRLTLTHEWPSHRDAQPFNFFHRLRPWWTPDGFVLFSWSSQTGPDRSFEFCGLEPGLYKVRLDPLTVQAMIGNEYAYAEAVVPGGPLVIDFTLPTVIVRVDYDEGSPRGSARVSITSGEKKSGTNADKQRFAYLAGPAGAVCVVEATHDGYLPASVNLELPAAGAVAHVALTLKKLQGGANLNLRVEDHLGAPIEGWFGIALHPDPDIEHAQSLDTAGRHVGDMLPIRDLRPGRWNVSVRGGGASGVTSFDGRAQANVELVGGETAELVLRLPLEGRWRMRVRDETGSSRAGTVKLERRESGPAPREPVHVSFQYTDVGAGIFHSGQSSPHSGDIHAIPPPFWDAFETLALGLYVVRVESKGYRPLAHEFEVRAGERVDVDLELVPE